VAEMLSGVMKAPPEIDTDVRQNPDMFSSPTLVTGGGASNRLPEVDTTSSLPEPPLPLADLAAPTITRTDAHSYEPTGEMYTGDDPKPAQRSSTKLVVAILAFLGLLIVVLGSAAVMIPKMLDSTVVSFQVQPDTVQSVEITVDGQVAYRGPSGDTIVLDGFPPGERVVVISADGYEPTTDTVKVSRGSNLLYPIKMKKLAEKANTSLAVKVTPSDAQVKVDGRVLRAEDGNTVNELSVGDHGLTVSLEGYKEHSASFSMAQGQSRTIEVKLEAKTFTLEIKSAKPVAVEVFQVKSDGQPVSIARGITPFVTEALSGIGRYDVVPGSGWSAVRGWKWDGEGPGNIELKKAVVAAKAPVPRKERDPKATTTRPKETRTVVVPKTTPEPKPRGKGTLVVASKPQAKIVIDGKSYGYTPKTNIKLSAGRHRVKLVMESIAKTKTYTVNIKPNQTVRVLGRP